LLSSYAVVFAIAPVIGQVTDAVANSPTAPFSGVHSDITAENVYRGFVAATVPEFTGCTVIVETVPNSG